MKQFLVALLVAGSFAVPSGAQTPRDRPAQAATGTARSAAVSWPPQRDALYYLQPSR